MLVAFYDNGTVVDDKLKYAVILARYNDEWIYVKHNKRNTWEIPGGRREVREIINETARRELYEETGAISFEIYPLCIYSVKRDNCDESFGSLYYAEVMEIGPIPAGSEINQLILHKGIPNVNELTYPAIQPVLYNKVLQILSIRDNQ